MYTASAVVILRMCPFFEQVLKNVSDRGGEGALNLRGRATDGRLQARRDTHY